MGGACALGAAFGENYHGSGPSFGENDFECFASTRVKSPAKAQSLDGASQIELVSLSFSTSPEESKRQTAAITFAQLSTLVQKFANVFLGFLGAARVAYLGQKVCKILASKFPLERFSLVLPVVLKIEEAFGDGVEVGEVVRG